MSGMCGWIDSPLESGQADGVLADMLGHLVGSDAAPDRPIICENERNCRPDWARARSTRIWQGR